MRYRERGWVDVRFSISDKRPGGSAEIPGSLV
jgi:hypothetical protein